MKRIALLLSLIAVFISGYSQSWKLYPVKTFSASDSCTVWNPVTKTYNRTLPSWGGGGGGGGVSTLTTAGTGAATLVGSNLNVPTPILTDFLRISNNLSDVTDPATARNFLLPSQTGNSGKVLQTNGASVSWQTVSGGGGGTTTNPVTFNSSGSGEASGATFDGSVARTISYNSIGAEPAISTLPVSKGGTSSGAALTNNKVMVSSGSAIIESSVTSTELGYSSGVTSAIQTQLGTREAIVGITAGGTANAITISPSLPATYTTGEKWTILLTSNNTTIVTINRNGLGAKTVKKGATFDLIAGDFKAGTSIVVQYDGTNFQLVNSGYVMNSASVPSRSGSVIAFDTPSIYNTVVSPATGNVTFDFTNAIANTEVVLYHHHTTAPTFPTEAKVMGIYLTSGDNEIRLIYRSGTEVDVTIRNTNTAGYISSDITIVPSADVSTILITIQDVTGMSTTLLANQRYRISGSLKIGCNNSGGLAFGFSYSSLVGVTSWINMSGRSSSTTSIIYAAANESSGANAVGATAFTTYAAPNSSLFIDGTITVGSSDITWGVGFASKTAGQTSTVYREGSSLKITKL